MSNRIKKKGEIHPNSKKWNEGSLGMAKRRTGVTDKVVFERCHICDFSPSNEESVYSDYDTGRKDNRGKNSCFLDPKTKKPICHRCWKDVTATHNEMLWYEDPSKEQQQFWENILDDMDLSVIDSDTQE